MRGSFKFESSVLYPCIPCDVDENTTVYPLSGDFLMTGIEYLLAKRMGCDLKIDEAYEIPFDRTEENGVLIYKNPPFKKIINDLQAIRRQHEKGTILNALNKDILNSIYGLTVRGINDKRKYDIKSGKTFRVIGNDLSSPIISSWTTAFIRSVIGELLYNVDVLGGVAASVTTDGFICTIPDLENRILNSDDPRIIKDLLELYRCIRVELSGDPCALEMKHSGENLHS